ncbi:MAG: hypothetical protein ACK5Z2_15160 [Bacteroidota bacterium]
MSFFEKFWPGNEGVSLDKRRLRPGNDIDHLFPRPLGVVTEIVPEGIAEVKHTIAFIEMAVPRTLHETAGIAKVLMHPNSLYESCKALWHFVANHIRYKYDERGIEQVQSPAHLWKNRKKGGDCDCMTSFINSVLHNWYKAGMRLSVSNVVAGYPEEPDRYKHIYPVCITPQGRRIPIDCVTPYFDHEEPYLFKAEFPMKLHYLHGTGVSGDLGKGKLKAKLKRTVSNTGKVVKRGVHAVNKVNPATVLMRTGLLASMKLNLFNVAGRLKFSYLSAEAAQQKGISREKYDKLIKVREKADRIFYAAGGKPENLREAILTGKGNKEGQVSGLGVIPIWAMPDEQRLTDIVGTRLLNAETGMQGLGEPVSASAAIAAASAAVAALAAELRKVGILGKGDSGSENPDQPGSTISASEAAKGSTLSSEDEDLPGSGLPDPDEKKGNPVVKWIKENPVTTGLITVGVGSLIYLGIKKSSGKSKPNTASSSVAGLSGKPRGRPKGQKNKHKSVPRFIPLK